MILEGMIVALSWWMMSMWWTMEMKSDWVMENRVVITKAIKEARDELELDKCEGAGWLERDSNEGKIRWMMKCEEWDFWRFVMIGVMVKDYNYVYKRETLYLKNKKAYKFKDVN